MFYGWWLSLRRFSRHPASRSGLGRQIGCKRLRVSVCLGCWSCLSDFFPLIISMNNISFSVCEFPKWKCPLIQSLSFLHPSWVYVALQTENDKTLKYCCSSFLAWVCVTLICTVLLRCALLAFAAPGLRDTGQPRRFPAVSQRGQEAPGLSRLGPPCADFRVEEAAAAGSAEVPHRYGAKRGLLWPPGPPAETAGCRV